MSAWGCLMVSLWVVGLAVVLFSLLVVGAFVNQVVDTVELDRHHVRTDAVVTSVQHGGRHPDSLQVRYRTADGRTLTTDLVAPTVDPYVPGDTVQIEYDPSHPSRMREVGSHDLLGIGAFTAAVLVGWAVAGWGVLRRRRRGERF